MDIELPLPRQVLVVVKDIVHNVCDNIAIKKIILYGSYSKGNYNDDSDIDLAFFINDINGNLRQAYNFILRLCSKYDFDVQPQVFYYYELEQPMGIIEEIVDFGIDITNI